jgi:hypothetical protein
MSSLATTSNSDAHETGVQMSRLDQIVRQAVDDGVAPFLCAAIADRNGVRWQGAAGRATPRPRRRC